MGCHSIITEELLAELAARNIACQCEPCHYLCGLTFESRRIHCFLPGTDQSRPRAGFWLHVGLGLGFLGLWSGLLFHVRRLSEMLNLAEDVISYCIMSRSGTPYSIPGTLLAKHSLAPCEIFSAWPICGAERLDEVDKSTLSSEFSLSKCIQQLKPHVDACEVQSNGLVLVTLAGASMLARFSADEVETARSFSVLIHSGCHASSGQSRLLMTVCDTLGCAFYDPEWNNKVYWDDPYYSFAGDISRSDQPRNAASNG